MRDPAGQRPHRFHFLRLTKLGLESLLLRLRVLPHGDVTEIHDYGLHAGFMQQVAQRRLDPAPRPVSVPRPSLVGHDLPWLANHLAPCGFALTNMLGMDVVRPRQPSELLGGIAEQPFCRWTDVEVALGETVQNNTVRTVVD